MSDIVEQLRAEIARKQDAEGDRLYLASPCPVLTEAAETILALRTAIKEAEIHIDCASFRKAQDILRATLSTTEAK